MSIAIANRVAPNSTSATPAWIVPLHAAADPGEAGGKGANLARLLALDAPVPDGFVLTNAALRLFIEGADLQPLIAALCGDPAAKTSTGLRCAAETVAALFLEEPMPAAIAGPLVAAWRDLSADAAAGGSGRHSVIVRSSAAGEDSGAASFAGQLDSIANVEDDATLQRAVAAVWASRWSHRALAYEAARSTPLAGMGVIVQRQVPAVVSGVLFTESPTSASHMLLEYCGGLGDALVSGAVNPGRLTIARRDFRWVQDAAPESPVPAAEALLTDPQIAALGRLVLELERGLGGPQDIEWAMDGEGRIWIVQARPAFAKASARQACANAPAQQILWSNANVNENFPQPISPLLYSIASAGYYHYFRNLGCAFGVSERRLALMEPSLRRIIGVHGARMYYNLTSIHGVLRAAPFGELLTASFNQFVGAGETAPASEGATFAARASGRVSQALEVAVIAVRTSWQYLFLTTRVERFEARAVAFAGRTHPDRLAHKSLEDLLDDFRGFLEIRCHRWNDAALADAASMVCYGALQRLLARAFPDRDQQALHNTLLKALPDLVSGMPPLKLWDLSRQIREDADLTALFATAGTRDILEALAQDPRFAVFRTALRHYLDEWGFRCSAELMLTVPSFQEDPAPVIDLLKAYIALDGPSPAGQLKQQSAERVEATARVLRALRRRRPARLAPLGSQALVVSIVLGWTQKAIQLRERARLKQALLYSRLRRIALAIGDRLAAEGRLASRDDVFFLTADEIDAVLSGHAMFPNHLRELVTVRREAHAELSAMAPPDTIRLPFGEYLPAGTMSQAPADRRGEAAASLTGVGACGGSTEGRAAVLAGVTESHRIAPGDVLVTRQTDPGWGPIFPLIAGLVIERGGMLSHGAIIAREFGIPSVVGVKDATRLIRHGARVTVDGDRGVVHVIAEQAPC